MKNGSIPERSLYIVTFQDKTICWDYYSAIIRSSVPQSQIHGVLVNHIGDTYIITFDYELVDGTLTISNGKTYNLNKQESGTYEAPTIAEILAISVI